MTGMRIWQKVSLEAFGMKMAELKDIEYGHKTQPCQFHLKRYQDWTSKAHMSLTP